MTLHVNSQCVVAGERASVHGSVTIEMSHPLVVEYPDDTERLALELGDMGVVEALVSEVLASQDFTIEWEDEPDD
jgi:hypothetical protein